MLQKLGLDKWIMLGALMVLSLSCVEEDKGDDAIQDNFDRQALLSFWADEIIIPAYENYSEELGQFDSLVQSYRAKQLQSDLIALKAQFQKAYIAWQWVSIYEIGPAESRGLRNYSNVYPCDTMELLGLASSANYNLSLPSTFDVQGWPAVDYLLFGPKDLGVSPELRQYLSDVSQRLLNLSQATLQDWKNSYRNSFVANAGSSADASVNKLINDFVFNYEKELRAGKIGIPAGVFSGMPLSNRAEAYYNGNLSKQLFLESLEAHRRFFAGLSYDSLNSGPSLKAYLDYLQIEENGTLLSTRIEDQFDLVEQVAAGLDSNLAKAATDQTTTMLQTFDALQQNVIWMKVDMMQALNVRVDYVDADGD